MNTDIKYITVGISTDTYNGLLQAAMLQGGGMHPQAFAGLMVLRGLNDFIESVDDPQLELFKLSQAMLNNRDNNRAVVMILKALNEYPDEDRLSTLLRLCDVLGIDIEKAQKSAQSEIGKTGLVKFSSTKVEVAKQWLLENMQPGFEYSAKEMAEKAASDGISKSQLTAARAALDIPTTRKSAGYVWRMSLYDVSESASK